MKGRKEGTGAFALEVDRADMGHGKRTAGGKEGRGLMAGNEDAFDAKVLPCGWEVRKGNPPIFRFLVYVQLKAEAEDAIVGLAKEALVKLTLNNQL